MSIFKRIVFILFVAVFPLLTALNLIFPEYHPVFSPVVSARPVLVIDAGHGGEDGGAISLSGIPESHLNLAIAQRVDLVLGIYGAPTVMLRQQDVSLHDSQSKTLREKKVSDLHNRVDLVSRQQNAVLLSIHQNSFPSRRYRGAQVFFAPTDGSKPFALVLQDTLRMVTDPSNNRQASAIPNSVYLMNHIACPAVLVECGFLTNPAEEQLLQDPNYETKLAAAMAGCWLNYSGNPSFQDRDEGTN